MNHFLNKKTAGVVLAVSLVIGGGGVAFAYFTSGGSGSGSANVGTTGATDFAITQSGPQGALYPGGAPLAFTVQAQNTGTSPATPSPPSSARLQRPALPWAKEKA